MGQPKLTKPTFGVLRVTVFKIVREVAGGPRIVLQNRPLAMLPADKGAGDSQTGRLCTALTLSNSGCQICDVVQEKAAQGRRMALKNGGAGPIKTLNVVTGPPEVGEVNTSNRA